MKLNSIFATIYRSYVLKNLFKDVSSFVKDNLEDIEWDKDYWLHKVGLTTYKPAKAGFGSLSLFLVGVAAGGVAALAFAPRPGIEFREQVKDKAMNLVGQARVTADKIANEVPARV